MTNARSQHILITGASSGIGTACAEYLQHRGYRIIAGVRRKEDGERLVADSGGRTSWVRIDVTDAASIEAAAATVAERVGDDGLYGLVNNAGIAIAGPLEAIPLDSIRRQFDVNVFGQLATIQAFASLLRQARGRVVNMSSVSGKAAFPLLGPYVGSKFALEAMSDTLRMELAHAGVRVSLVEPGVVDTPIWEKSNKSIEEMINNLPEEARERYRPMIDAVKAGTERSRRSAVSPERVARAVYHALSATRPRTRYIVGRDAWLMIRIVNRFPDRLRDWVFRVALGL